ncbi:MAG: hypothetical protein LBH22_00505 [Bacteroidales bacterium]|jgi:hypothetical protein|nr:hypothetical protein [Bacteroidales bacterium]
MKHKIKLLLVTAFVTSTAALHAQNIFFPTKTGTVLMFAQKDDHGAITGYLRQTLNAVEGSNDNMTIHYLYESMDKNHTTLVEVPCEMLIKDGMMIFDLKYPFVGKLKSSNEKIIGVTGTPLQFPNNLMPGETLKDAHMNANIARGIINVHVDVSMTDGKCVDIEEVTVPAGTFKSHKITQTVAITKLGSTDHTYVVSWGAPNVGIVKSETYDGNHQLLNSMELVEMK